MEKLNSFFQSHRFTDFYQGFSTIGLGASILICILMVFLIIRMDKKYRIKKKKIERMLSVSGMEDTEWFLKERLKKHGIKPNKKIKKKN